MSRCLFGAVLSALKEPEACLIIALHNPIDNSHSRCFFSSGSHRISFFVGASLRQIPQAHRDGLNVISNAIQFCPSLDNVPPHQIATFIRCLQSRIKSDSRSLALLSINSCENSHASFGHNFMLVTILLRRKVEAAKQLDRSTAPLCMSLHSILALITTGRDALKIVNVQNVSLQYALELENYAHRLMLDTTTRSLLTKRLGIQGWREECLYAWWEAALLKENLLTRWVVLLGK